VSRGPRGLASALDRIDAKHRDEPDFRARDDVARNEEELDLSGDEMMLLEFWGED
jgi:hypothetical protein